MNKFTILNLSDLHIEKEKEGIQKRILDDFISSFKKENIPEWEPGYIVISGDVINQGNPDNYKTAENILKEIAKELHIEQDHIIIVPGNHDKNASAISDSRSYSAVRKNFEDFCKIGSNRNKDKETIDEFIELQSKGFKDFNTFYKNLACNTTAQHKHKFETYTHLEHEDIKYITGIKIFEEDQVCFLCLNTEWLYAENKITKGLNPKEIDLKIGRNIIADLHNRIQTKYKDFRVITLMHRNPSDISWFETNDYDPMSKKTSPMKRILKKEYTSIFYMKI